MIRHEAYSRLEVVDKEPNREVIMLSDLQFRVFGPYAIPHAEVWGTATRAIHDQELMLDENGLGNHRAQTSGTGESENGGDEVDEENNEIAHARILTSEKDDEF